MQKPIYLKAFENGSGLLVPLEIAKKFPDFTVKRIFYCYGFKAGEIRGCHAHKETNQLLICLQGKIHLEIFDGKIQRKFMLEKNTAIFIPKGLWNSEFYLEDAVLLVLCDSEYSRSDYIEDPEEYLKYVTERK